MSYTDLNTEANALGWALRARGIGPGSRVGICLPRSPAFVVTVLAVLKIGAAYVPLDVDYPRERLEFLAADADLSAIVGNDAAADLCARTGVPYVSATGRADGRIDDLNVPVAPTDPAYVIYTSGTTGRPKGVVVRHENASNLIDRAAREFRFGPDDTILLAHSFSFDFSVWEMWTALAYGATLVVAEHTEMRDPRTAARLIAQESVTVLNQTPSSFYRLWRAVADNGGADRLRLVIFGGERLDPAKLRKTLEPIGPTGVEFVNMYGITETTVHVTRMAVDIDGLASESRSLIGTPIAGVSVSVRDPAGEVCGAGIPGELWVGGSGVASGYLNLPKLTADRFVTVTGDDGSNEVFYRSGDLGRVDSDGIIEFLGRVDRQINIRGYRVEPAEVEAVLIERCDLRQAVVVYHDDALAALVVRGDESPDSHQIRRRVGEVLPPFMVPSLVVAVPEIPLDPHGKVDTAGLLHLATRRGDRAGRGALTTTQKAVLDVWQIVLGRTVHDIDANFFDVGGHSLAAVDVADRLAEYGYSISVIDLFAAPTIRACADRLDSAASSHGEREAFAERRRRFVETVGALANRRYGKSD